MKSFAANALLAALSIALTLAVVEIGLRVAGYPPALTDHSEFMRRDPALGWALRPGVTGTYVSDEYAHNVRVNSRGMRGPEPPAAAGEVRIVLLGDSFVEGYSVAEEERVSESLEARLRAVGGCEVRVVPMGTAGYSTDQQLIWLERDGLSMEPDAVVLMFYFNDVWYNGRQTYFGADKPYFQLRDDSLEGPFLPTPDPPATAGGAARDGDDGENDAARRPARSGGSSGMRLYRLAERTAKNSDFLRSAAIRLGLADPPPEARIAAVGPDGLPTELQVFVSRESEEVVRAWGITARLIRRMADLTASSGAEFTIFQVPFRGRVHPDAGAPLAGAVDLSAVADRLAGLCARHGLDCMDPAPEFRRTARDGDGDGEGGRLYYHMDTHWTAAGHAVAADLLAARLGDNVRAWCAHARAEAP